MRSSFSRRFFKKWNGYIEVEYMLMSMSVDSQEKKKVVLVQFFVEFESICVYSKKGYGQCDAAYVPRGLSDTNAFWKRCVLRHSTTTSRSEIHFADFLFSTHTNLYPRLFLGEPSRYSGRLDILPIPSEFRQRYRQNCTRIRH